MTNFILPRDTQCLVRVWIDPYNENNQYRQIDTHPAPNSSIYDLTKQFCRGIVINLSTDEVIFSWGF